MNLPTGRRATDGTPPPDLPPWLRTVIGGLLLAALIGGASAFISNFETVAAHTADITGIRSDIQRVLDVVCEDKPTARACK